MEVPQKIKNETYISKGTQTINLKEYMHPYVIAALSTTAKI